MKKYYQVFISSPSGELKEQRSQIIDTLYRQEKYIPVAMEFMNASSNIFAMLFNYLKNSDVCVLLLCKNCGSSIGYAAEYLSDEMVKYLSDWCSLYGIELGDISYSEFEYVTAKHLGINIIPFCEENIEGYANSATNTSVSRIYADVRAKAAYRYITPENISTSLNKYFNENDNSVGWIRETDSEIFKSMLTAGVTDIDLDGVLEKDKIKSILTTKTDLYIFFTTGKSFFTSNSMLLTEYVANGGNIHFLCAKPNSAFLNDVQKIEECAGYGSRESIHAELNIVIVELKEILNRAQNINPECDTGTIEIGFCETLFRSSFFIAVDGSNQATGLFTITLPPAKSKETISLVINSDNSGGTNNLAKRALTHFEYVWRIAKEENSIYSISDKLYIYALDSKDIDKRYWQEKEVLANKNAKKRKRNKGILIEVAAQHPLKDGELPDEEFAARLNVAYEFYVREAKAGKNVEIFVPGDLHLDFDGVPDDVSLSYAGVEYLINKGVPAEALHGEDYNRKFESDKFHKGVYNTADECYIAAKRFEEGINEFKELYCVCSPNQVMRKMLFYLEFGIYPKIVTVPTEKMYHNFVNEMFEAVPYIVHDDHNYQGTDSSEAVRTRKERMPGYKENHE